MDTCSRRFEEHCPRQESVMIYVSYQVVDDVLI